MDPRLRRGLLALGVVVVTVSLVAAGGFVYFALTFGSADHTEFTLTAERVPRDHIAAAATANLSAREREIVAEAARNGSARTVATDLALDGAYVERNGSYYRVRAEPAPAVTRERPVLRIEAVEDPDGEVVPAAELPDPDRDAFMLSWKAWTVRQEGGREGPPARYVYETVPEGSVFVPEQEVRYVAHENRTFRVRVRNESVELDAIDYHLELVARTESAFVDELVVPLDARLNATEAAPLERAIANGTYVSRERTFDAAARPIEPIARAFGTAPREFLYEVDGPLVRYARYEGRYYRVTLEGEMSVT